MTAPVTAGRTLVTVLALALLEIIEHFRFFLQVGVKKQARDHLLLLLFSTLITALKVSGTVVQRSYYATRFQTAELNGVFYRTPTGQAVETWREQSGEGLIFSYKASKFITHWKRLSSGYDASLALLEWRF